MQFPVWSLEERVGEVVWEEDGIYWTFRSELLHDREGFVRLYLHSRDRSVRLGLYGRRDGRLTLSGRISRRAAGSMEAPFAFCVQKEPYLPPDAFAAPLLPFAAQYRGDILCYCIPIEKADDRTLPYCCFFVTARIGGEDCVLLTLDADGNPLAEDVSQ